MSTDEYFQVSSLNFAKVVAVLGTICCKRSQTCVKILTTSVHVINNFLQERSSLMMMMETNIDPLIRIWVRGREEWHKQRKPCVSWILIIMLYGMYTYFLFNDEYK